MPPPLSVGVTVSLVLHDRAGGHVKCWQRLAEAATGFPEAVDLTVYFLGPKRSAHALSPTVRYRTVPAQFGTDRLPLIRQGAGDTDLARRNVTLAPMLRGHDLLHVTDTFALSRTAQVLAKRAGVPLVYSVHTDYPRFADIYTAEVIENLLGTGAVSRFALDMLGARARAVQDARRAVDGMMTAADHIITSNTEDAAAAVAHGGQARHSHLRRGIDTRRFTPDLRDSAGLRTRFSIPDGRTVALFVGRVDDSKGVMIAAEAVKQAIARGADLHLLAVGKGRRQRDLKRCLGGRVTVAGHLPQAELPALYASADLFVFPSHTEVAGNVVVEAMASGLAPVLADAPALVQWLRRPGEDGLLVAPIAAPAFAEALGALTADPARRQAMGQAALATSRQHIVDWPTVFRDDVLAVWHRLAGRAGEGVTA